MQEDIREYRSDCLGGEVMNTLYLCGAGNCEGVRLALAINQKQARWDRIILLDDDPTKHGQLILGVEVAGPFGMLGQADADSSEVANLVTRTPAKRLSARRKIEAYDLPFATLIHPSVEIDEVTFGRDVTVYQNAIVSPRATLEEGSVIWMGAAVGQESQLGRFCIVGPHAVVNGRVKLGDGVYVGTNATVLPELKVGSWATIGAGSVAMQHVPAGATVLGVPGKVVWVVRQKPLKMEPSKPLPRALHAELESPAR